MLRRVELAFLAFKAAESGTRVAMLVYAYGLGGATAAMPMFLDGFVAGPNAGPGNALGDGCLR